MTAVTGVWDARTATDVGGMLLRYLREHPSPAESELADELQLLGDYLERQGLEALSGFGARRLRVAETSEGA